MHRVGHCPEMTAARPMPPSPTLAKGVQRQGHDQVENEDSHSTPDTLVAALAIAPFALIAHFCPPVDRLRVRRLRHGLVVRHRMRLQFTPLPCSPAGPVRLLISCRPSSASHARSRTNQPERSSPLIYCSRSAKRRVLSSKADKTPSRPNWGV